MENPVCLVCRNPLNLKNDEVVAVPGGKIHKNCYEKIHITGKKKKPREKKEVEKKMEDNAAKPKTKKPNLKICYYCHNTIDIDTEKFYKPVINRYAHEKCYKENYNDDTEYIDKIYSFLKEDLLINYNFLQCEKQRACYVKDLGYTNKGILDALKYFYLVKKMTPEKSGNRIGIVPYIYNEAKEYYENIEKKKEQLVQVVSEQINKQPLTLKVKLPEQKVDKGFIDIDSIEGVD